jgi:RNA polymerase sigma factor (sigma-70 family)
MDHDRHRFGSHNEKRLLEKCLAGDKGAWDIFVEGYSGLISQAIIRTLNRYAAQADRQIVEDIFQTVFLSLIADNFKKLNQFRHKCKLSTWLYTVAVRVTIDHLRKRTEHLSLNGQCGEEKPLKETLTSGNPGPSEVLERKEEKEIFEQIKETLTARERLFVELFYHRELNPDKIARIMNTNKNNVYQMKNLVGKKMQRIMNRFL